MCKNIHKKSETEDGTFEKEYHLFFVIFMDKKTFSFYS